MYYQTIVIPFVKGSNLTNYTLFVSQSIDFETGEVISISVIIYSVISGCYYDIVQIIFYHSQNSL